MKANQFKVFHEAVATANKNSDVWYAGYLWLDLTDKQADKISNILWSKNCVDVDLKKGWFIFPNGLKYQTKWIMKVQKSVNEALNKVKKDLEG